jgi:4-hydroxybenzoate polyprenyltransferase
MMPTALLPFFHWLRLTRPWNVLAMGGMVWIVMRWLGSDLTTLWHLGQSGWIVVPMLVGAAGNLINDYFDVREDRINKPNRALVGRLVKRRVVMVTHWGFTIAALCWSGWLASNADTSWPIVMVGLFSVVLYVYSPMLKGNGALGNVAISICVGGLVVWAAMGSGAIDSAEAWTFALLLAILNFIREWVKDVQDKVGDRAAHHHTMAMRLNPDQNRIGVLFGLTLTGIMVVLWSAKVTIALPAILMWAAIYLATIQKAFNANYKSLSAWIKALMGALFLLIVEL